METEKFQGVKELEIKSYNGCVKKGYRYRAVYLFDNKGQATESLNYFKKKLLKKYEYRYNEKGLLIEKIQTFDINNKNKIDTIRFVYEFDKQGRVISKSEFFGRWIVQKNFQDFNENEFPTTVIRTFDNKTTTIQKEYDSLGNEYIIKKAENDSVTILEEKRYNVKGDLSYSFIPDLVGKEKKELAIYIGGNRFAAIEEYEYIYDKLNRWIEKYVVFENKKLLIEKRKYK